MSGVPATRDVVEARELWWRDGKQHPDERHRGAEAERTAGNAKHRALHDELPHDVA